MHMDLDTYKYVLTYKKNTKENSVKELRNLSCCTNRFTDNLWSESSLQLNQGFYGKSIQNSFICWLKNPSHLQTKVKQVISQIHDNQEVV